MTFKMSKTEKPRGYSEIDLDSEYRSFDKVAIMSHKHWVVIDKTDSSVVFVGVPFVKSNENHLSHRVSTLVLEGQIPATDLNVGGVFSSDHIARIATLQSVKIIEINDAHRYYVASFNQ